MKKEQTTLDVSDMTCDSCVRHVNAALSKLDGVSKVDVKLSDGKVFVEHDAALAKVEALIAALRDAGYESKASS